MSLGRAIGLALLIVGAGCTPSAEPEPPDTGRDVDARAVRLIRAVQQAYGQGAFHDALALADSAAAYAPDWAEVYFARGLIFSKLYRFDEAQVAYEAVLARDPTYRSVWFNLGHNAFLRGQYRTALGYYQEEVEAIDATPEAIREANRAAFRAARSAVVQQVGRAYEKLGVVDSAETAYAEALATDSSNAQAYSWMSELAGQAGEREAALAYAQEALRRAPNDPAYQYGVGAYLFRTGQAAEAIGYLEAVVAAQPWHAGAHYNLGQALMALGRPDEAQPYAARADSLQRLQTDITLAQLAAFQHPNDPHAWQQLANLLGAAGRRAEAQQAQGIALSLQAR